MIAVGWAETVSLKTAKTAVVVARRGEVQLRFPDEERLFAAVWSHRLAFADFASRLVGFARGGGPTGFLAPGRDGDLRVRIAPQCRAGLIACLGLAADFAFPPGA